MDYNEKIKRIDQLQKDLKIKDIEIEADRIGCIDLCLSSLISRLENNDLSSSKTVKIIM